MSFQLTPAYSSRIKKGRKQSLTSPLRSLHSSSARRRSSGAQKVSEEYDEDEPLPDTGIIASLATSLHFRDVPQFMTYIRAQQFDPIPDRGAGMNSSRIAEVLNFRVGLPPIVSIAHIDALSTSSTQIEREIVELALKGVLRRVSISSRGIGAKAVGEGVVLFEEWEKMVRGCDGLDEEVKDKYLYLLNTHRTSSTIPNIALTSAETSALTTFGFLTTATGATQVASAFARPSLGSLSSLSAAGSKHAAGTMGAVGGFSSSQYTAGGGGGHQDRPIAHYNFSLPNTGSHIRLLIESRTHLLDLLKKSKYREVPWDMLRERWDGGILGDDAASQAKKSRGEFKGILPGRTKKWKTFWGLKFEWVVEECVGAGLVEVFETGSVGRGIRAV